MSHVVQPRVSVEVTVQLPHWAKDFDPTRLDEHWDSLIDRLEAIGEMKESPDLRDITATIAMFQDLVESGLVTVINPDDDLGPPITR